MKAYGMKLEEVSYDFNPFTKRYLLFATEQHYPAGGMWDCEGSFDTIEEVMEYLLEEDEYYECPRYDNGDWDSLSLFDTRDRSFYQIHIIETFDNGTNEDKEIQS